MNKKVTATILGLSAMVAASAAIAEPNGGFYTRGRVLKTEPIFETVRVNRPEERCWDERVPVRTTRPYPGNRSYTPAIAGAIIGGVLGHEIGAGSGQDWATAGGALLGGSIARDAYNRPRYAPETSYVVERRCERVDHFEDRRELVGYRVKYEYDGRTFWTQTHEHPGKWVEVKVDVHANEAPHR
jgi:uncharacterized protein YcfJ